MKRKKGNYECEKRKECQHINTPLRLSLDSMSYTPYSNKLKERTAIGD